MPESLPLSFSNHLLASPLATPSTQYRQWRVVTINLPQSSLKDPTLLRDNIPFHHDECFILPSGTDDRFPFSLCLLLQDSPSSKRDFLTGTCLIPPKRDRRGPCLPAGRKGHNMNEISFARILLAAACPGSPALWAGSFIFPFSVLTSPPFSLGPSCPKRRREQ